MSGVVAVQLVIIFVLYIKYAQKVTQMNKWKKLLHYEFTEKIILRHKLEKLIDKLKVEKENNLSNPFLQQEVEEEESDGNSQTTPKTISPSIEKNKCSNPFHDPSDPSNEIQSISSESFLSISFKSSSSIETSIDFNNQKRSWNNIEYGVNMCECGMSL